MASQWGVGNRKGVRRSHLCRCSQLWVTASTTIPLNSSNSLLRRMSLKRPQFNNQACKQATQLCFKAYKKTRSARLILSGAAHTHNFNVAQGLKRYKKEKTTISQEILKACSRFWYNLRNMSTTIVLVSKVKNCCYSTVWQGLPSSFDPYHPNQILNIQK